MELPFLQERDEFDGSLFAGKYQIRRRIGRGGMGAVYQATHVLMDRVVAIKIVRANFASKDNLCLQRFRLEAKASSCLNHPNIMTVYDFGITDDGVAYLVMDYIDGEGLDVVLRRDGFLSPARAIGIFSEACNALAHAHDKGVVHRDLKPSNIMLVRDEYGREHVKIVDFGIARMLPGRARSAEVLDDGGQVIGSPLYMSPEQCIDDEQDGRSDVYSLGCLLYEALAGFAPMSDKHVLGIMYKHLNEPARPFATAAPERRVPAELEQVVLRALAKNPSERHQTMEHFEAALKHALEVDTQQHHYVERTHVAEHVIGTPPGGTTSGHDIDPIEQHYIRQLRSAQDQFGTDDAEVVPYLHQLGDYYVSRNKPSRAERQFRAAVEVLVQSYGPWDIRVAEAVLRLAELYRLNGRALDAEPLYLDLLKIKKTALGKDHPDIPFVMMRLAELYFGVARLDQAYKYYSQCLRIAEDIFGPDDPVLSAIIIGLASVMMQMQKLEESAWLYNRAIELNEYNLGPTHPGIIGPLVALGVVYRKLENWNESERVLLRALDVHRLNYDTDTSEIAHALWLLAEIYTYRQMFAEAEKLYEHVLIYFERANSDDDFVAQLYNNYGVHFVRLQQMERAETQFIKALRIRETKYGRTSEQVASSLNLIATLYHSQDKYDLAEVYYHRSLDACRELPGAKDLTSANLTGLGDLYAEQNRFAEAEPAYKQAMEVRNAEESDPQTQQIMHSLLNLYKAANGIGETVICDE
jgi:serine/threonine protein kinase/Tfp pilus assembly protein PilF